MKWCEYCDIDYTDDRYVFCPGCGAELLEKEVEGNEENMEGETNKNIRNCDMYELCLNHQFCISCEDKEYFTKYVIVQED